MATVEALADVEAGVAAMVALVAAGCGGDGCCIVRAGGVGRGGCDAGGDDGGGGGACDGRGGSGGGSVGGASAVEALPTALATAPADGTNLTPWMELVWLEVPVFKRDLLSGGTF